jgi:hypothetical protein
MPATPEALGAARTPAGDDSSTPRAVARTPAGDAAPQAAPRPVVVRTPARDATAPDGQAVARTGAAASPVPDAPQAPTPRRGLMRRIRPSASAADTAADSSAAPEQAVARSALSRLRRAGSSAAGDTPSPAGDVLARSPAGEPDPAAEPGRQETGASRPVLRVMRSETPQDATAPAPEAAPDPRTASGMAQRLARATAGAIQYEDDGRVGVIFPPPGAVFGSSEQQVAREGGEPADAMPATSPPAEPAHAGAAGPAGAAGAPLDRDELYADFMRRLRRDVLEQREQLGDL